MKRTHQRRDLQHDACAKVNLTLEVLGKRPDGYHQVASVMQTIELRDRLRFAPAGQISLTCNLASLETPDNLVLRAAALLQQHTGCEQGAEIHLEKAIPQAAGLGGGSSDAAVTLRGLNTLWGLDLGLEELRSLGASLGSDVPFFLQGGTALAEGRGELVKPLQPLPPVLFVLVVPQVEIPHKTAALYGHLSPAHYTGGEATQAVRRSLEEGRRPAGELLFNAFEAVAFGLFPQVEECRRAFLAAGAPWVRLAGSGPALYTFMTSAVKASTLVKRLREAGYRPWVTLAAPSP
ncbi:hypothetical protein LCGC14_1479540 [marine sediment metagenome]|uniref:4-(cytidine 5'-diphospho)-2-C-methyl-D-erythritol kinase n=1 Tax=marine sediment metagenome TaxID=412755 RepID=A0A0F9J9X6_9ZZZZ